MNGDKKFVVPSYCHPEPHKRHPELVSGSVGGSAVKVKDSELNSE